MYAALLAAGGGLAGSFVRILSRRHPAARKVAGAIFLLAGINDTLTYWFL